ncbi:hypothetical protein LCGC14_1058630 [marine sediment metagenome]|uniref:Uncharacterized protein n=1 Tax=marine sediment metagenome TaxID=412755 RepID=A0A0F9MRC1_9ZZZZ
MTAAVDEKAAAKAKKGWALREKLKESRRTATYCVCSLLGKGCKRYGSSDCVNGVPECDHPSLWLRDGKPAVFVSQPYQIRDPKRLGEFCAERGLECMIRTWPAWHYRGSVLHVEIRRKGERL